MWERETKRRERERERWVKEKRKDGRGGHWKCKQMSGS